MINALWNGLLRRALLAALCLSATFASLPATGAWNGPGGAEARYPVKFGQAAFGVGTWLSDTCFAGLVGPGRLVLGEPARWHLEVAELGAKTEPRLLKRVEEINRHLSRRALTNVPVLRGVLERGVFVVAMETSTGAHWLLSRPGSLQEIPYHAPRYAIMMPVWLPGGSSWLSVPVFMGTAEGELRKFTINGGSVTESLDKKVDTGLEPIGANASGELLVLSGSLPESRDLHLQNIGPAGRHTLWNVAYPRGFSVLKGVTMSDDGRRLAWLFAPGQDEASGRQDRSVARSSADRAADGYFIGLSRADGEGFHELKRGGTARERKLAGEKSFVRWTPDSRSVAFYSRHSIVVVRAPQGPALAAKAGLFR